MRSIVLLSGGVDSATALYKTVRSSDKVIALTFDYEIRQDHELAAAKRLAKSAGVRHQVVELPFYKNLRGSPSSSKRRLGPERQGISSAYVPARNIVFFGVAAAYAEVFGAEEVVTGHISGDSSRFPDATSKFVSAMNRLIGIAKKPGGVAPKVKMPLVGLTKEQVLKEAIRFKVPLEETWSCYNNGEEPCGICYGCTSRREAFRALGVEDPWMIKRQDSI